MFYPPGTKLYTPNGRHCATITDVYEQDINKPFDVRYMVENYLHYWTGVEPTGILYQQSLDTHIQHYGLRVERAFYVKQLTFNDLLYRKTHYEKPPKIFNA